MSNNYNAQGYASPPLTVTSTDTYELIEVKGTGAYTGNSGSSSSNLVYCYLVNKKAIQPEWSCASVAADAVAQTGDSYVTSTPPAGYLPI